jgi:hypothetical protein
MDVLLSSTGLEPTTLNERAKWHLVARLIPLVENNFTVCELGRDEWVRAMCTRRSAPTAGIEGSIMDIYRVCLTFIRPCIRTACTSCSNSIIKEESGGYTIIFKTY